MALEVTIDHTVLAFTLGISVFATILFGLAPALHQTALDLHSTLKEGGRTSSESRASNRTRSVLVVAEIALALALLICAGIFVPYSYKMYAGFGIDPNRVLTANISLSSRRYKDPSKQVAFFQEVLCNQSRLSSHAADPADSRPELPPFRHRTGTARGRRKSGICSALLPERAAGR
jgi:hypothetical protein